MSSKPASKRKAKAGVPRAKRSAVAVKLPPSAGTGGSEDADLVGDSAAISDQEEEVTPYESLLATISKDSVRKHVYSKPKKVTVAATDGQPLSHDTHVTLGDPSEAEADLLDKDDADYRDNELGSEEGGEEGEEEDEEEVGEETEGQQCGPFSSHLEYLLSEQDVRALQQPPQTDCDIVQIPELGLVSHQKWIQRSKPVVSGKGEEQVTVKQRLSSLWPVVNKTTQEKPCTSLQNHLLEYMAAYKDVLCTRRSFDNGEEMRRLYVLHALNHILKTRSRVLRNNAKILQAHKEGKEVGEFPDQGFTRPKVLIVVPFREAAYRTVNAMTSLLLAEGEGQVTHRRRFAREYTDQEKYPEPKKPKPASHKAMFEGNIDDCFKIGIGVSRKVVKLYCDFYSSDVIVASPLGLRTVIGAEGDKSRDFDFLSSLEMVIVDQADVYLMQNWEHVTHLFKHLHLQPRQSHGVDISRLRPWVPNGWSKYYCQTLVFSSFPTPEIVSLFLKRCHNYEGRVTIHAPACEGSIRQVATPLPQVFQRVECGSQVEEFDQRFRYFCEKIIPEFSTPLMQGTAIFIQSYFDFVRVRNYLKKEDTNFCQICEYTRTPDVKRARVRFYHKQRHFLIFTERFHFFHRHQIKGIRHVIFYQLPTYAEFYSEILNAVESSDSPEQNAPACRVLYSRYDEQKLSRIVGSARAQHMLSSGEKVHMFFSGQ